MSPPIRDGSGSSIGSIRLGDGTEISEVRTGAGDVLFSAIPDSVDSLYEYEDDSDTSTAVDSVGSNNASISGAAYNTDSAVGSLALDHANGDSTASNNTVDLVSQGSENAVGLSAFVKPDSEPTDSFYSPISWAVDSDNFLRLLEINGQWSVNVQVGGTDIRAESGIQLDSATYTHCVIFATQSEVGIYVDNTLEATKTHSQDITNIGPATVRTGTSPPAPNNYVGLVDDFAQFDAEPTGDDVNTMFNRA